MILSAKDCLFHQGAWAVRIYYKPFVRWIWLGAIIMSIGGLFAASDRRYRRLARDRKLGQETAESAI